MSSPSPTARRVLRLQLGILVRRYREQASITPKEVADALGWYPAKVSKLENGTVTMVATEVDRLIQLFGVTGDEADKLRKLGAEAHKRGVILRVPDWAQTYVEMEQVAAEIKLYDGELIPSPLQTEDYARAVLSTWLNTPADEVDQQVKERARRKDRLSGDAPPKLWIVLGEATLHRLVGGPAVLRGQLQQLRELTRLKNVTFQILPFSTGEHVALGTSFTLLHLAESATSYAYLESLHDGDCLYRPSDVEVYTLAFNRLLVAAVDERKSLRMLDRRIKELDQA